MKRGLLASLCNILCDSPNPFAAVSGPDLLNGTANSDCIRNDKRLLVNSFGGGLTQCSDFGKFIRLMIAELRAVELRLSGHGNSIKDNDIIFRLN